jgi:UDP-N-acetylglucosamine 2-epimerase
MKVLTVVGARPQFVKAAAVSRVLREDHEEVLVHTGQHYDEDMSDVFFEELSIPFPDTNLSVGSDTHGRQTGAMLSGLEAEIEAEEPDAVLVYGDTNSTLAAAIATSKMDPPLAHVEAGMRSGSEIPEETNRVLTDHAADLLFVSSTDAAANLAREGITEGVHNSGDVGYDALLWARERADRDILSDFDVEGREFVLATVHRDTNADDPDKLEAIVDALVSDPRPVVLPAHPRTVARLEEFGLYGRTERELTLTEPLGYRQFVALMDAATAVATDSGGVQKEAFFLDTPCVTLRDETEWVETVESGWNTLVGADEGAIRTALSNTTTPTEKPTPYGDGTAAERIVEVLSDVTRL